MAETTNTVASENTESVNTNGQHERVPASFDSIDLENVKFEGKFKVLRGCASQLVLAFSAMAEKLPEGADDGQKLLYEKMKELVPQLREKYVELLLTTTEGVQRRVFGSILNGVNNDGRLVHVVYSPPLRFDLSYDYVRFGDLLRVLGQRLRFVMDRPADSFRRFRENEDEKREFLLLKERATTFYEYLETVRNQWHEAVQSVRTLRQDTNEGASGGSQSQSQSQSQTQTQTRQPRRQYQQRTNSYQSGQPRRQYQQYNRRSEGEQEYRPRRQFNSYNRYQDGQESGYRPRQYQQRRQYQDRREERPEEDGEQETQTRVVVQQPFRSYRRPVQSQRLER